ncbi:CDP-glycerol glycerophosphotransferase family protein [Enterococcus faecium]|nr:CDP-glycerol glycerophosphotransferase family protein [Enterococcus faecium]
MINMHVFDKEITFTGVAGDAISLFCNGQEMEKVFHSSSSATFECPVERVDMRIQLFEEHREITEEVLNFTEYFLHDKQHRYHVKKELQNYVMNEQKAVVMQFKEETSNELVSHGHGKYEINNLIAIEEANIVGKIGPYLYVLDFGIDKDGLLVLDERYVENSFVEVTLSLPNASYQLKPRPKRTFYDDFTLTISEVTTRDGIVVFDVENKANIAAAYITVGDKLIPGKVQDTQALSFDWNEIITAGGQVTLFLLINGGIIRINQLIIGKNAIPNSYYIEQQLFLNISKKIRSILLDYNFAKAGKLPAKLLSANEETLEFLISKQSAGLSLIIKERGNRNTYLVHPESDENHYSFSIQDFMIDQAKIMKGKRYDLFVAVLDVQGMKVYRLHNRGTLPKKKADRFFSILGEVEEDASLYTQRFQLYIANNNTFAIVKQNESNLLKERYSLKTEITQFEYRYPEASLEMKLTIPENEALSVSYLSLVRRNKDGFTQIRIPDIEVQKIKTGMTVQATINYENYRFEPLYWDPYLVVNDGIRQYHVRLNNSSKNAIKNIKNNTLSYQFHTEDDFLLYPYVTLSGDISFTYRKREYYETKSNQLKEKAAYYLARLLKPYFAKKDIWIAFEKLAESAHDSGYHFFNYCYQNKKHNQFYYVIQKGATEEKFLADKQDRVLHFMSFKYFLYLFSASLLISSDTKRNVYNLKQKETYMGRVLSDKPLAYLQHGVNGLKKVPDFYKNRDVFDLVSVPSDFEKEFVLRDWGYSDDEVVVTGLARWDVMEDRTDQIPFKQIFVMPTWRTWMDGLTKEKFVETDYYQQYSSFLDSDKLKQMLLENNARIAFFLHPKFKEYIDLFDIDPEIISKYEFLEVPLDDMIMKSSMMISDYSSIIWEMYYLKKPCVFFQFDIDKYMQYEGMYMDPKTDLFGDAAYSTEELLTLIEENIKNDFQEKEKYTELRKDYFSLMDHHNSERIYEAIMASDVKNAKNGGIRPLGLKDFLLKFKGGK